MPPPGDFESLLGQWETDRTLLEQTEFPRRMAILDELDRYPSESELPGTDSRSELIKRTRAIAAKLDSANTEYFSIIRRQIQAGACPAEFVQLLHDRAAPGGLAYDYLDDLVAGVFQFEPPTEESRDLSPDSVFYQPTPARHIFHLIGAAAIAKTDTLIDLGSGLGHVPLLASICTGATSIGIELDPAWVDCAQKCAETLNVRRVSFNTQDAREADFSTGTVFYLYTPFTGTILSSVVESLRRQAALRPIRICTFGPCALSLSNEPWLKPLTPPSTDQITVFLPG